MFVDAGGLFPINCDCPLGPPFDMPTQNNGLKMASWVGGTCDYNILDSGCQYISYRLMFRL